MSFNPPSNTSLIRQQSCFEPIDVDVDDILKSSEFDMASSSQFSHADDITTLLLDLCDSEEERTQGISVTRDIFDPIPLKEITNNNNNNILQENQIVPNDQYEDFHHQRTSSPNSTEKYSQSVVPCYTVSPSPEAPRFIDCDFSFLRDAPIDNGSASSEEHSDSSSCPKELDYSPKFRGYQREQWTVRYDELCKFYDENGHSSVPHTDRSNKCLARWVKRQRYQYKLRQEGKPSAMTDERVRALERLDFVWDSHGAAWEDRLKDLEDFKAKHKHCNVPSNFRANSSLAAWIKCQRRQYRLFLEGKKSNITKDRIEQLERMGFQFNVRGGCHMTGGSCW